MSSKTYRSARNPVPFFETMEDRRLMSATQFDVTKLVSDLNGAVAKDFNSHNAWGLAYSAKGPYFVNNNGGGVVTRYNPTNGPLDFAVRIPTPTATLGGLPTGIAYSDSSGFKISSAGKIGPSRFISVTEEGLITGWNEKVNRNHAIIAVNRSGEGAVYTGATLARNNGNLFLYVANFHSKTIEVYNRNFKSVKLSGSFVDPKVPARFAPFNIQKLGDRLFVTYAKQDATYTGQVSGAGNGFVAVFNTNGRLIKHLASRGTLNTPWGVALAPSNFGTFSNNLLVSNFGDGKISAFNATTGKFVGKLTAGDGSDVAIDGLWGLSFGNGHLAGASDTLFFTAGPNHEGDGLFGSIAPAP